MTRVALALLVVLLLVASVYDVRYRRIPNKLVLVLLAAGVGVSFIHRGVGGAGLAILLAVIGMLMWLPFYSFRMMGAGDIKLFAAGAAWLVSVSDVLLAGLIAAIAGGVMGILWTTIQGRTLNVVGNLLTFIRFRVPVVVESQYAKLPYGIAMAAGILWSFRTGL
jgi:prepilin peptidase CpaA